MPGIKQPRRDVAAEITYLIIRKLEEGVPPWSRPLSMGRAGDRPAVPQNTLHRYQHALSLGDCRRREYRSRYWMTYRQAEALGGNVRRGETGAVSVYYSSFKKHEAHPETGQDGRALLHNAYAV